jgi:RHS repeat-associated protein
VLQELTYSYDRVGNITAIADTSQREVLFDNAVASPSATYTYDAIYRLIAATGREHAGGLADVQRGVDDLPLNALPHPNDPTAIRLYEEEYVFDAVGNLLELVHSAVGNTPASWTRRYDYLGEATGPTPASNRLQSTSLPGDTPGVVPYSAEYAYDAHGNITAMPHLASIDYDHADRMREADLGGGGTAYYVYNADGSRARKVIQRIGTLVEERIYLGGWEVYRKRDHTGLLLERETLHVMDDRRRVAMFETKTVDTSVSGGFTPVPRFRFQLDDHIWSARLELDETGLVISYEEFHPYGTSAYRSARSGVEVSERRFRYTGKERDEETGFQIHGLRYYCPWLGRWTTADPIGLQGGVNQYAYCRGDPVGKVDPGGTSPFDWGVGDMVKTAVGQSLQGRDGSGSSGTPRGPPPAERTGTTEVSDPADEVRVGKTDVTHAEDEGRAPGQWTEADYHTITQTVGQREPYQSGGSAAVGGAMVLGILNDVLPNSADWAALADTFALGTLQKKWEGEAAQAQQGGAGPTGKPNAPTGAYREGSGGGEGFGKLADKPIRVSEKGLSLVESHLEQFGPVPQNQVMVSRLREALKSGSKVTGADASFYMHEASEATMMRRGLSYEQAHPAALQKYEVSPFSVYHPEAIQANPEAFNSSWRRFWETKR